MADVGPGVTDQLLIRRDGDIVAARQMGRNLAADLGFSRSDQALIATVISELARNIISYAGHGAIRVSRVSLGRRVGICIAADDNGPGIADIELAMTDGFSTGRSLGLGLPGSRRIVDDFTITSAPGQGVHIVAVKWKTS